MAQTEDPMMLAVQAAYRRTIATLPDDAAQLGLSLLDRLSPPGWTLEWYLPVWLCDTFGLPAAVAQSLVLANVYGLVYVCLQDDLTDGDTNPADRKPAQHLAAAIYEAWVAVYAHHLGRDTQFWRRFNRYMARWRHATASSNAQPTVNFETFINRKYLLLAERAAPLKICCAAACLLAGQPHILPALEAALDHLHVAAVLLDHAGDWVDDLDAGRYNTFVHYVSEAPQSPANRELHRRLILEELWSGAEARPYFQIAASHLQHASTCAQTSDCAGLIDYIQSFAHHVAECRSQMSRNAKEVLHRATVQLFGVSATIVG